MAVELSRNTQRWVARAPAIANVLLVILLALAAARLFWLAWPESEATMLPARTAPGDARRAEPVDVDAIAAANLFGERAREESATAAEREILNAPETRLNLTLTGIISQANGSRSRALIQQGNRNQEAFSAGDEIGDGVDLHAIYADRVILDRNGRFETLTLESVKQNQSMEGVQRASRASNTPVSGEVNEQTAESLSQVRDQILQNPENASRYIRLQPERQNGNLVGYRIFPGDERALFDEAGLEAGELVTAVNGQPLDNSAASLRLLSNLASAGSASVTLERDGQQRTVTVNF